MATAVYSEPLAQMTDLMLEASTSSSFATAGSESDYHPGAKRGYPGTSSNYITPPLQRKGGAVPATVAVQVAATQRPTVMAVRVVEPPPLFIEPKIALPPAKPATAAAIEPTPCTWARGAPAPRRRAGFARKLRKVRTAKPTRHQPHGPPCRRELLSLTAALPIRVPPPVQKSPSPCSGKNDGYASSENSLCVKLSDAMPKDLGAVRDTLEDAEANMSALLSDEISDELAAFTAGQNAAGSRVATALLPPSPPPMSSFGFGHGDPIISGPSERRSSRKNSSASAPLAPPSKAMKSTASSTAASAAPVAAKASGKVAPPPEIEGCNDLFSMVEDDVQLFDELTEAELNALPSDASRRKVRHNLTERRRVDRMNQLFHRLAMSIVDEKAAPAISMANFDEAERALTAEGKELAKPKWSKADVLEGAIAVVNDLRRRLAEERLARSLSVPARTSISRMEPDDEEAEGEGYGCDMDDDDAMNEVAAAMYPLSAIPSLNID